MNPTALFRQSRRTLIPLLCAVLLAGCATTSLPPETARHHLAARQLHEGRRAGQTLEQRAAHYIEAAAAAAPLMGQEEPVAVRDLYNDAVTELTLLLRSAEGGRLWNKPFSVSADGTLYRLRFAPASRTQGIWDPAYFDELLRPSETQEKKLKVQVRDAGYGGMLVGVHRSPDPVGEFLPDSGVTAPVTAVVEFSEARAGGRGVRDMVLSLHDPSLIETARIAGRTRPLAADFTAPLAYYPRSRWLGFMEMIRADRFFHTARLRMLQPYDPARIPVVCVHGLMSEPGMWRDTIDAVESDPELRGRFQFWAFGYPTGDPIAVSALEFRQSLAAIYRRYPRTKDMVLISHSLGGLLSKMQTVNTGRVVWDGVFGDEAEALHAKVPPDGIVKQALTFEANPRVSRVVFICVPHRGSPLATGASGAIALSLIHMPAHLIDGIQQQIGHSLAAMSGQKGFVFPPSVHDLSPQSPLLKSLDTLPIQAPHHTIAGDRGKGNSPRSSDGVVKYESSQIKTSQSELIVPGPHSSCALPQTVAELQRILHLHLKTTSRTNR